MNTTDETPNEEFRKAPRLSLGKNICSNCGKAFMAIEHELQMPGTKDFESVFCPYCDTYNGEVFINGTVHTRKIEE